MDDRLVIGDGFSADLIALAEARGMRVVTGADATRVVSIQDRPPRSDLVALTSTRSDAEYLAPASRPIDAARALAQLHLDTPKPNRAQRREARRGR